MGLACKITGHKWNGCVCTRCGEHRDTGHDWQLFVEEYTETVWVDKHHVKRCAMKCSICGRTKSAEHDWDGCKCARCGETRNRDHVWGKPEQREGVSDARTHHRVRCERCGKHAFSPHTFVQKEGCRHCCSGCGYEEVHHEFVDGMCRDCGIGESDYYADLIASGKVGYYDIESERKLVKYGDHVTTIPALTRLFVALADNDGADNYAPESITRKLNDIASEQPEKTDAVNAALAQFACDERVHIYWRSWVAEHDFIKDSGLLDEARESVKRWREAHPRSQADIDYENAMIASDSGLYTTG